jgi:hypothetical protein
LGGIKKENMAKRGNPGLKGKLLDKSIEAYVLSLETINRLSIKYRVENFAYLICNAWELLLKAKIIQDTNNRQSIFYPKKKDEQLRSLALRDCIKKVFPNENDPIRRNLEYIAELRDESVHLIISQIPKSVLSLFQSCVLNYHKQLISWFDIPLSERVSVGMMAIVYDFNPNQNDLTNPKMRRELGPDVIKYLLQFESNLKQESDRLNKPVEFSIDINYKLALVKNVEDADIVISKGESGLPSSIIEVPKDPSRTHPYRQGEVVEQVNSRLHGTKSINPYDIQSINIVYEIRKRPDFYYKGKIKGSPTQYSLTFIEWIIKEYDKNNNFFEQTRTKRRQM